MTEVACKRPCRLSAMTGPVPPSGPSALLPVSVLAGQQGGCGGRCWCLAQHPADGDGRRERL